MLSNARAGISPAGIRGNLPTCIVLVTALWQRFPLDGLGWGGRFDREYGRLRSWAAGRWYGKYPASVRPFLYLANRAAWPMAAAVRVGRFARSHRLGFRAAAGLYLDCVRGGGDPVDLFVWRRLYREAHPMPARSAALLLSALGDPAGHSLLSDKLALGQRLSEMGVRVPRLHAVCRDRHPICLEELNGAGAVSGLFVKPRCGSGGRNAFAVVQSGDGWQIDGVPVHPDRLIAHLAHLAQGDDLLVQERLLVAESLADLSCLGRAPVLRLTTSRAPGGPPTLHSALMMIPRPGMQPRNFLSGQIYAPIDPAWGTIKGGVALDSPDTLLDCREPGGPRISGRAVPFFAEAVETALHAMAAVPPVPAIHWDIILTSDGPVFLEGNSIGNWIVATLPGRYGLEIESLTTTLDRWLGTAAPVKRRSLNPMLSQRRSRAGVSGRQMKLILESIICLAAARLALLIWPFQNVAMRLGDLVAPNDPRALAVLAAAPPDSARFAAEIGRVVGAVARWMPFRAVCLQQALAAHAMLRRRHIASALHLGSGRDGAGKLVAHAWLDSEGLPVTGYPVAPHIHEIGCFVPRRDPAAEAGAGHGGGAANGQHNGVRQIGQ